MKGEKRFSIMAEDGRLAGRETKKSRREGTLKDVAKKRKKKEKDCRR